MTTTLKTPTSTTTTIKSPMLPALSTIRKVRQETYDTYTLEMDPPGGNNFKFEPGQFNMLYAFGVGEVPISVSGDPDRPEVLVHTLRAVGPVTRTITALKPGAVVGVRGPYGVPWPVEEAEGRDVVIVAGGIGLAPLRPAIYHVLNHRDRYGAVVLLYGARSPQDLLYTKELEQWRGRFDMDVAVTVDTATKGWKGRVGLVTSIIPPARFDPNDTVAMVVGPEVMMRFVVRELENKGVPDESIFISMERNMKCGVGLCGHCQLGPHFVCKDGPVYRFSEIGTWFGKREV